jgi:hypothetical protein
MSFHRGFKKVKIIKQISRKVKGHEEFGDQNCLGYLVKNHYFGDNLEILIVNTSRGFKVISYQ